MTFSKIPEIAEFAEPLFPSNLREQANSESQLKSAHLSRSHWSRELSETF